MGKRGKQKGFSLIEVIIALVVMSIGSLALATLTINSQKATRNVASLVDFNAVSGLIQQVTSTGDPALCGSFFTGVPSGGSYPQVVFAPGSTGPGPIASAIPISHLRLANGEFLDATGKSVNGWIYKLEIDHIIQSTEAPTFLVNVHLTATRDQTQPGEIGAAERSRDFQFDITTKDTGPNHTGNIVGCSGGIYHSVCTSLKGTWHPPTSAATAPGTCVLPVPPAPKLTCKLYQTILFAHSCFASEIQTGYGVFYGTGPNAYQVTCCTLT